MRIIADNRANRILIKGDPDSRKRLRQMIKMLDVPSADRLGGLKVSRLKYASAKNLAEILQGLVTGQSVSSSSNSSASKSNSISNLVSNNQNSGSSTGTSTSSISTPSN